MTTTRQDYDALRDEVCRAGWPCALRQTATDDGPNSDGYAYPHKANFSGELALVRQDLLDRDTE